MPESRGGDRQTGQLRRAVERLSPRVRHMLASAIRELRDGGPG